MEYQSILKMIEDQKKDQVLSEKIFRYSGLIKAIEFFSQKLNFTQIIEAAFDFTNELLTLQKSAIYVRQGNCYALMKIKGYENKIEAIENNKKLQDMARFDGNLLCDKERIMSFFNRDIIDSCGVKIVIPLMIDDYLYGFILISCKAVGEMDSDDYIISEALMKLFNNALESFNRYEELQNMNRELDEKIFNLFAINQSSKALLSELNLDNLYSLSVDVFSELTQSSVTGFVLYDDKIEKYSIKAAKDIFNSGGRYQMDLDLNTCAKIDISRIVLSTSNDEDTDYFNRIFNNGSEFIQKMKSRYIVLLLKYDNILGFVSLGPTSTNVPYKKSILELTESLASAAYIALSNASFFERINEQKRIIEDKLNKLISLNRLSNNINSSSSTDILIELTLKTLEVSFGVEKALIAVYNQQDNTFAINRTLNFNTRKKKIKVNSNWDRVFEGDTVFEASENGAARYIDTLFLNDAGNISGVMIVPVYIDKFETEMLGVIIVLKYKNARINDDENMLIIETIAAQIAPIMSNLSVIENQSRLLQVNHVEMFKKDLKKEVIDAENYMIYLEVIYIEDDRHCSLFEENPLIKKVGKSFDKFYPFTNNRILIISNKAEYRAKIMKLKDTEGIDVKSLIFGKDFDKYEQVIKKLNNFSK